MNEEECDTTKYECTDEGTLDGDDSVRMTTPSIQNVCVRKPETLYGMDNTMKSGEPENIAM